MHRDESEETVAQLAGGWLAALRTGYAAMNSTADPPGSCTASAIDTGTKSRVLDEEWQAERSMDALSRFLEPENADNSRSPQNAIFQPRLNRAGDGMEIFSSIRADSDNSVSPAISSPSPTDMSVNVAATMHLSHPTHAINAVSSALAHSAPRRLSLALAAAANLSSSRCSLPSSTSTESLSLLPSNRNTSPALRPSSQGHLNSRSHLSQAFKTESCLSTYLDGGETLSRQSSESVTSPTVEGADNTTVHIESLSEPNKDDRNGYVVDPGPKSTVVIRSKSSKPFKTITSIKDSSKHCNNPDVYHEAAVEGK
ncbi:hypothetical protein HDU77_000709 [Chytriomyces hyalinus]|nr:hypothetical protein HDU77_000709 [Chytriomyces hyalinus]